MTRLPRREVQCHSQDSIEWGLWAGVEFHRWKEVAGYRYRCWV